MRDRATLAAMLALLSGCALMKQGTEQPVTFKSKPPGAEIWVNGRKHKDLTPATITLSKKEQAIVFKLKGYYDKTQLMKCRTSSNFYWSLVLGVVAAGIDWFSGAWREFEIPENSTVLVDLDPREDNREQVVYISSTPAGATIKIGSLELKEKTGIRSKATPVQIIWGRDEREKRVIIQFQNFATAELALRRGQKELHKDLEPLPSQVKVLFESDPPGAEVFVNEMRVAKTPERVELQWLVHSEPWKVEMRRDGYHPWKTTIEGKEDKTVLGRLKEKEYPVQVKIDCVPAGAAIEIDGKPAGTAPAVLDLVWSVNRKRHTLKVTRPGYESQELTIDDTQKSVSVRLRPALPRLP